MKGLIRKLISGISHNALGPLPLRQKFHVRLSNSCQWQHVTELPAIIEVLRQDQQAPVIIGPWISELGFEILYWIPFLRWLRRHTGLKRKRAIAVSRGGVATWYADLANRYVDIFDVLEVDQFRIENARRAASTPLASQKHTTYSDLDRNIVARVLQKTGCKDALIIHPSLMYDLFAPTWDGQAGQRHIMDHISIRPFTQPLPLDFPLPPRFVAAKFYARPSMPLSERNQSLVDDLVLRIASHTPVVSLSLTCRPDDHGEFALPSHPNIVPMREFIAPQRNLEIQSSIISRSLGLIGTYGGFSYLSLMYGKPSVGLIVQDKPSLARHYGLAALTAYRMKTTCAALYPESLCLLDASLDGQGFLARDH